MPPTTVRWKADPHTLAKHQILGKYIETWFAVMGQSPFDKRFAFIDGFSGPGEYDQDDGTTRDGSPLIALGKLLPQLERGIGKIADKEFNFLFIDNDPRRIEYLETVAVRRLGKLPDQVKVFYANGNFNDEVTAILDSIEPGKVLIPAFVMVDPFGFKDVPMALLHRVLENPKSEVLITFMTDRVNQFLSTPDASVQAHFEELLGGSASDWQHVLRSPDRFDALLDFYAERVRAKARYVRSFRMINKRGHPVYDLVFATNHHKGLDAVKKAMWNVDPIAGGGFSDRTAGMDTLFDKSKPDTRTLRRQLVAEFSGRTVFTSEVVRYAIEETAFHSGQVKRATLSPMEADELIEYVPPRFADETKKRRRGTFPPGSKIRFE